MVYEMDLQVLVDTNLGSISRRAGETAAMRACDPAHTHCTHPGATSYRSR